MIRGPIDGKYVELWGIPAWRRKLGIGDETETLTQRIERIIFGTPGGAPDSGPGSEDNANDRLAAFATLEEAGYVVQTSTDPPQFAGRQIVGTDNQINVVFGTGIPGNTILQLPQDIHTEATPEFLTIKPTLLNPSFVTYVDAIGELASTTITATQLETAVDSAAAMDILTTRGDLLSHDGTTYIRVGIGAANTVARTDGLDVLWGQVVLTTDVTGVLPVANGGTNKASWTAGSVIFAGAGGTSLAEDNANFFWNDTTNRLGLGIALPTALLHIETANCNLKIRGNLASGTYGYLTQSATATFLNHNAYATGSNQFTADAGGVGAASIQLDRGFIALRVSSSAAVPPANIVWTEGLRVINSGFVGIGTTAPGVICDIGLAGTRAGVVRLAGLTSGNVTIQTASIAGTWTFTLPIDDGTNGQVLSTDGAGTGTSWVTRASLPIVLTTDVTGVLPIANGGTNVASFSTSFGLVYYSPTATNLLSTSYITSFDGKRLDITDPNGEAGLYLDISRSGATVNNTANGCLRITDTSTCSTASTDRKLVALYHGGSNTGASSVDYGIHMTSQKYTETQYHIYSAINGNTGVGTRSTSNASIYSEAINGVISYALILKASGGVTANYAIYIHEGATLLGAGVSGALGAPLKFPSGINLTTPEAGAIEYNDRFFLTDVDAVRRHIVQAVNATKTTAGAPYANDGYVEMVINGTTLRFLTTA